MTSIFPEPISHLPEADIPLKGVQAFMAQGDGHQILFMEFAEDVDLPEHSHESQWAVVLEGKIRLAIGGVTREYQKGDRYYIPKDVPHSGKIFAGYADVTFFNQADRYQKK